MSTEIRWTTADLEALPNDGKHYEIIDGALYMSTRPDWHHDFVCGRMFRFLDEWNEQTNLGLAMLTPGLIFADDDNVSPDVIWMSRERVAGATDDKGHLRRTPEIVVEVLSPGQPNYERDKDIKRKLYSRRGVREYWLIDWQLQQAEIYRREETMLVLHATLYADDMLQSALLPGFGCRLGRLFADI
ncbi:MAG: Uma2 family endonuclease [Chloroflexaceae bacterium]|nr:Uma2 family endonuclease [Chloroflexaceae bacterium]